MCDEDRYCKGSMRDQWTDRGKVTGILMIGDIYDEECSEYGSEDLTENCLSARSTIE